jgi:hypothetical protein
MVLGGRVGIAGCVCDDGRRWKLIPGTSATNGTCRAKQLMVRVT